MARQGNKCSNIPIFHCLNVLNAEKQQELKSFFCFLNFDLTKVEKRQKWSTVRMFQMKWNGKNEKEKGNVLNVLARHEKQVNKCGQGLKVLTQTVHRYIERHSDRFVHWIDSIPPIFYRIKTNLKFNQSVTNQKLIFS